MLEGFVYAFTFAGSLIRVVQREPNKPRTTKDGEKSPFGYNNGINRSNKLELLNLLKSFAEKTFLLWKKCIRNKIVK